MAIVVASVRVSLDAMTVSQTVDEHAFIFIAIRSLHASLSMPFVLIKLALVAGSIFLEVSSRAMPLIFYPCALVLFSVRVQYVSLAILLIVLPLSLVLLPITPVHSPKSVANCYPFSILVYFQNVSAVDSVFEL